jgi:hypothetical protein
MGADQSSNSSARTSTTIINENQLNSFNKSVFNTGIETLIKTANSCSNAVAQSNDCSSNNVTAGGDYIDNSVQSNTAKVSFSCVNSSSAKTGMASEMMAKASAEMKAAADAKLASDQTAQGSASTTTGAGATAIGNSSATNSSTVVDTNIKNKTVQNIQNLYEQKLNSAFTSDTVNECIGKTVQENKTSRNNINAAGNVKTSCIQTNSLEAVQECKALADVVNSVTQQVLQESGIKVATESTTKQESIAKTESSNTAVATGPIQDAGAAIAGIVGAASGGPILSIVGVICCVIVCIVVVMGMAKGGGDMGNMNPAAALTGGTKKNKMKGGGDIISNTAVSLISNIMSSDSKYL